MFNTFRLTAEKFQASSAANHPSTPGDIPSASLGIELVGFLVIFTCMILMRFGL